MLVNVFGVLINTGRLVYVKPTRRPDLFIAVFDTGDETFAYQEYDNRTVFIEVPSEVPDPASAIAALINNGTV